MKERLWYWMTQVSFSLLLPFLVTCAMNGVETALINKKFDMENCISFIVERQIPGKYEAEAIAAQAVIARTNLYYQLKNKGGLEFVHQLKEGVEYNQEDYVEKFRKFFSYPHYLYQKAVLDTNNVVLTYEDELKLVPYHQCSGGLTREGEEVFRDSQYSYLKSVDSGFDQESPNYIYVTYVSEEQLSGEIEEMEHDMAGYVMSLEINGKILEGETFRQGMNLPSSNFSVKKIEDKYQIICRGVGHGLGFSQYGGNRLAKKGKSWKEILDIYFPEMSICKIFREPGQN